MLVWLFDALNDWWTRKSSIKQSPIKILRNFKVLIDYQRDELNEDNFTFALNEDFCWTFNIEQIRETDNILEYESILFDNEELIVNQSQIKSSLYESTFLI